MGGFYKQTDYKQIQGIEGKHPISEIGSMLIAQCNLIKSLKLGYEVNPAELNNYFIDKGIYRASNEGFRDRLAWNSLTKYDSTIKVETIAHDWPQTNYAVVKFRCQSSEVPYITIDGEQKPNIINHFCAVSDFTQKLIIDSYDGLEKEAGPYGTPVSYAAYSAPETRAEKKINPKRSYIWVKYDNFYDVARRLGFGSKELKEHNDLDDPETLKPGDIISLPKDREIPEEREVRYELLVHTMKMHVGKPGGTKKWTFANVKSWEDVTSIGYFPQYTNVDIVAIAHVPLTDTDGNQIEAAYYMDERALGDFATTKRVRYTIGYSWSDLAEGYYLSSSPPPPIIEERLTQQEAVAAAASLEDTPKRIAPNSYKRTLQFLSGGSEQMTVGIPEEGLVDEETGKRFVWVYEHDGRRPDAKLFHNWEGDIIGTFTKDGELYGLPTKAHENGYWFGLPMQFLQSNANDLYNTVIDAQTLQKAKGSLSLDERLVWLPLAKATAKVEGWKNKHNKTKG